MVDEFPWYCGRIPLPFDLNGLCSFQYCKRYVIRLYFSYWWQGVVVHQRFKAKSSLQFGNLPTLWELYLLIVDEFPLFSLKPAIVDKFPWSQERSMVDEFPP